MKVAKSNVIVMLPLNACLENSSPPSVHRVTPMAFGRPLLSALYTVRRWRAVLAHEVINACEVDEGVGGVAIERGLLASAVHAIVGGALQSALLVQVDVASAVASSATKDGNEEKEQPKKKIRRGQRFRACS